MTSLDPAAPLPVTPDGRTAVSLADLARRVAILERSGKGSSKWIPMSLQPGWSGGDNIAQRFPSYWLDDNGVVHFGGELITPVASQPVGTLIATGLPAPAFPINFTAQQLVSTGLGNVGLTVNTDGRLTTYSGANGPNNQVIIDNFAYRTV